MQGHLCNLNQVKPRFKTDVLPTSAWTNNKEIKSQIEYDIIVANTGV